MRFNVHSYAESRKLFYLDLHTNVRSLACALPVDPNDLSQVLSTRTDVPVTYSLAWEVQDPGQPHPLQQTPSPKPDEMKFCASTRFYHYFLRLSMFLSTETLSIGGTRPVVKLPTALCNRDDSVTKNMLSLRKK